VELFSRYQNSAGERVRIALNLKGIAYDYVPLGSLTPDAYRAINPQGLAPALRIDGKVIAQSTAILEYLEETHPTPPLLPRDPIARAEVRGFAQLITSEVHPLNNLRVRLYLRDRLDVDEAEGRDWYCHWIRTAFAALETTLAARTEELPFCFGDAPGWADLHLVPQMANARMFDCDLSDFPLLCAIDARCAALDAFRLARPNAQVDYPSRTG
jgi:maleylacetoacetate isomerase